MRRSEFKNDLTSDHSTSRHAAAAVFVTTQWTQVLQARGDSPAAKAALSDLCGAYYAPVFAFIRRMTRDEESARDLAQEFFARLLARHGLDTVDQEKGRFRSFLLGAVKHFLADVHDREHRLKRGGGKSFESLESGTDTSPGLQVPDDKVRGPDREFDRKWALTLLDRALLSLAKAHGGNSKQFEVLKPWLTGDAENLRQAEAARALGLNENAVKVAIHRLRRRFREAIKTEISQTVTDPSHVNEELRHLLEALG
jgi:RNA polymerase sigma factor (sigma-70 family)